MDPKADGVDVVPVTELLGAAAEVKVDGWDANAENPPPPPPPNAPDAGLMRDDCPKAGCEV